MLDAPLQFDLFAPLSRPAFPPPRPIEWERLVQQSGAAGALWVHASHRWQTVVVEQLCAPGRGRRWILWRDRRGYLITGYPAHHTAIPHRTVFLAPDGACELHRSLPLIEIDRGDGWAKFRPAEPGDAPPPRLTIPPPRDRT